MMQLDVQKANIEHRQLILSNKIGALKELKIGASKKCDHYSPDGDFLPVKMEVGVKLHCPLCGVILPEAKEKD